MLRPQEAGGTNTNANKFFTMQLALGGFVAPTKAGDYKWHSLWTPFTGATGSTLNQPATVESQSTIHIANSLLTIGAKKVGKHVVLTGKLVVGGEAMDGVIVQLKHGVTKTKLVSMGNVKTNSSGVWISKATLDPSSSRSARRSANRISAQRGVRRHSASRIWTPLLAAPVSSAGSSTFARRFTNRYRTRRGPVTGPSSFSTLLRPRLRHMGRMARMLQTPVEGARAGENRVGVGVAARLSRYLQVLTQAQKMGKDRISSQEIADYTNINATQIRRDLSNFGKFGKRGVGYSIDGLLGEIRKILRTQGQHNIALVGAGRLGQAIAGSSIFGEHGITIAAVFDNDERSSARRSARRGDRLRPPARRDPRQEHRRRRARGACDAAQQAADDLVDAGVRIIFNYSEALLDVPADVTVHTSNPAVELLHALYFHLA